MINKLLLIAYILIMHFEMQGKDITVSPEKVDFGTVLVNSISQNRTIEISNKQDTNTYSIIKIEILNNYGNLFSYYSSLPLEIPKYSSKTIKVLLNPSGVPKGEYSANLVMQLNDKSKDDDSLILPLTVRITEPNDETNYIKLRIPNLNLKTGESFDLPIIVDSIKFNATPIRYRFILKFNSSMLVTSDPQKSGNINNGVESIVVESQLPKVPIKGDTLYKINMITTLGNALSTEISISELQFYNSNQAIKLIDTILLGSVSINDIFIDKGIPRLLTQIPENLNIFPINNPISTDFNLRVGYIGTPTLEIYSLMGVRIANLSSLITAHSTYQEISVPINLNIFPTKDMYIIRLSTINLTTNKMIIIE